MKVTILGSGYVGLVTAAGFAELGCRVLCVDVDAARVDALRRGEIPFFEPGLRDVVERNAREDRLHFETSIASAFSESDAYFVCVGTPPGERGRADVSAVFTASRSIAEVARKPAVLAVKSTVPVGTCDAVEDAIRPIAKVALSVASNPEFLKEGAALDDFFKPDRVIVGVADEASERFFRDFYRPLQLAGDRLLVMDRRSSELAKYASNAMLAVRISFMNELSQLCDKIGADITSIRRAVGSDRRIGPQFLYAGPGYGGSCFPKDVSALHGLAEDYDIRLGVVEAAGAANRRQKRYVIERVLSAFPEGVAGKTFAVWGLAFKPETDDVRESPAAALVGDLMERGAAIHAHDPEAISNFAKFHAPDATYFDDAYAAVEGADALVLMTEWRQYRTPDFDEIRRRLRQPKIIDARNLWAVHRLNERGFEYRGIGTTAGRPPPSRTTTAR